MVEECYQQNEIEASKEKHQDKVDEDLNAFNSNTFYSTLSQIVETTTEKEYISTRNVDKEDAEKIDIFE